jgi:hypothetical protein
VVDGSNIATEGRAMPSLRQLHEAVMAFRDEHPDWLVTVVVDATFGHRIDAREVPEFDAAIANNELVAPPAGAVGRGDGFVLSIANKVGAVVLSNDSYQEFHGQYTWLFDEGRLYGGKPVPHIGWVFVPRTPVRGPISRKAVSDAKRKQSPRKAARIGSPEASQPMPIPTAPPPGARLAKPAAAKAERAPRSRPAADAPKTAAAPATIPRSGPVNDVLPFLSFVEHHPVGTSVVAVVDHYSSHGAYVRIGDVIGYVPLRLMADPAPRSAREVMAIGENVTLVVDSFVAARRSIDLALPIMAPVAAAPTRAARAPRKKAADTAVVDAPAAAGGVDTAPAPARRSRKPAASAATVEPMPPAEPVKAKTPRKQAAAKAAPEVPAAENPAAPAKATRKKAAAKTSAPSPAAEPTSKATRKKTAPSTTAPDPEPAPKRTRKKVAG